MNQKETIEWNLFVAETKEEDAYKAAVSRTAEAIFVAAIPTRGWGLSEDDLAYLSAATFEAAVAFHKVQRKWAKAFSDEAARRRAERREGGDK